MKTIFSIIILIFSITIKAQIPPILDHIWTIEKIDTGSQIINADLNPFGEYDNFFLIYIGMADSNLFYGLQEVYFGHCSFLFSFDGSNSDLFYHLQGCLLDSQDSSQIALYFNDVFIHQNTNGDNSFSNFPVSYGPLTYSFSTVGDIIYLDITNSIGEVATFYATNLSQEAFLSHQVKVYPNPVKDILYLESPGIALESLNIYDLKGRLVEQNKIVNNQINVSHLQQGVYIIEIKTSVGVLRRKLIKR